MGRIMMKKAVKIGIGAIALLSVCIIILCVFFPPSGKSSSQSDYPVLEDSPFAISRDLEFPRYVTSSDLIVDATVRQVLPEMSEVYVPEEGSPEQKIQEQQGLGDYVFEHRPIELEIHDVWTGSVDSPTLTLRITAEEYQSVPDFQPGDRLIFFLSYVQGIYYLSDPRGGLYYVAFDDKVYPTFLFETIKEYSGKKVGDFKRDVQGAWAQKDTPPEP